jgi:uncharacterized protein YxjI
MLNRPHYFIKEHTGLFKLTDSYDILDPDTQTKLGQAREEVSGLVKILRLLINKSFMPTRIAIYGGSKEEAQELRFSIRRGVALFRPQVDITDADGHSLGYFKTKAFTIGGAFRVFTPDDQEIALVKGDWKGWNFKFTSGDTELGEVTKKWAGIGKELFTSADNYMIRIHGEPDATINTLLLAAGLAIDMIYKEKK